MWETAFFLEMDLWAVRNRILPHGIQERKAILNSVLDGIVYDPHDTSEDINA